jgi:hypothetical protein
MLIFGLYPLPKADFMANIFITARSDQWRRRDVALYEIARIFKQFSRFRPQLFASISLLTREDSIKVDDNRLWITLCRSLKQGP